MLSRVDQIYRSILLTKFFVRGWGKPENLRRIFAFRKILSNRETCQHLVDKNHPVTITKEVDGGDHLVWEGEFVSPYVDQLPGLLPKESQVARFQMVLPKVWHSSLKPTCLHLAGTGDHGFWRRKMLMAKPLLDEGGIASIMLENPFYGCRKPKDQIRSSLHNVSDLFVMGGCLVLESLAIFHWCERMGFGPLGITGISMGGHMASLAATNWHKPLPLIPCLSSSTASGVFTQGVLTGAINWEMLKNQYFSNEVFRDELFKMIHSPEGDFPVYHEIGQKFARDFPGSLSQVEQLMVDDRRGMEDRGQIGGLGGGELGGTKVTRKLKRNILQSFGLSKSKISGVKTKTNILTGYQKAKSNVSKPVRELTPVGLRTETQPGLVGTQPEQSGKKPRTNTFEPYMKVQDALTWEAVQFMRGIMDECTHLGNFSVPVDPSLIIIVAAKNDGYMPCDGIIPLSKLWPGSELRTLPTGHVAAYLFNHQVFRQSIRDSFDRLIEKYYSEARASEG